MRSSGMVWVMRGSISIFFSMYQSTIRGTSVRPRAPPKAEPFQTRPVTSWKGRVAISCPAPATPVTTLTPQPPWQPSPAPPPPAAVAALERLPHQRDVADALEAVVGAAAGQLDQVRDQIAGHRARI